MVERSFQPAESFKDYYQLLHLHPSADAAMVDQAYWHLARLYNQESATNPEARRKLDALNEAYSVLRSPQAREAYDKLRNEVLGEGALPVAPSPAPASPPLPVMAKQRPRARVVTPEGAEVRQERLPLRGELFGVLPWQSLLGCVVIAALAAAALMSGVPALLVFALLIIGLALLLLPLVRKLPHLIVFPSPEFHMPAIRPPRVTDHHLTSAPSIDTDTLRRSTEAMRRRWRQEVESGPLHSTTDAPTDSQSSQRDTPGR